jgi:hypothetical protein
MTSFVASKSAIESLRDIQLITNYDIGQKYSLSDQSFLAFDHFSKEDRYIVEQSLENFLESSL